MPEAVGAESRDQIDRCLERMYTPHCFSLHQTCRSTGYAMTQPLGAAVLSKSELLCLRWQHKPARSRAHHPTSVSQWPRTLTEL